ncbi:hypothetical protein SPIROBIBN47_400037 [uncultured spirochete]|uniref:Uncharacterized protein n=1 Tax=uncultured spirochete TaxID=156406 RepID=A0A3P3XL43_9SPIR|nr:hypothetical protein SPIROBIBN47_400037 [uncultured spirochete]
MGVVSTGQLTLYDVNDPTSSLFTEFWDGDWASRWVNYVGSGEMSVAVDSTLPVGALALTVGNNSGNDMVWLIAKQNIPFDANKLYKLTFYVKRTAGTGTTYLGVAGVAPDGVTLVNNTGVNSFSNQHYIAASGVSPGSSWTKYVGYIKGTAATGTTSACPTPESPGKLHTNCRYFRPMILVNYTAAAGTNVVGAVTVEVMPELADIPNGNDTRDKAVASDAQLTAMASDSIITPQEKLFALGRWCEWYNDTAATSALPTAPTTDGRYKRIVDSANSVSGWTPTTAGTASKAFYDALEALRAYLFSSPGVVLAGTWSTNITITKSTWLTLWVTAEATAQALETEIAGKQGLTANLSNDSHLVPTDADGNNGNFAGCATTMSIYKMGVDDSANWTVAARPSSGVTGSLSGKTYTVTALSVDAGYVDLTASRTGYPSITLRFTIVKAKGGAAFWLVSSADAIQKSQAGVYTPSTITFTGKRSASAGVVVDYAGRFIIAETTDGSTYTDKYTSSANETSKTYTPSAGIKALRCRLYLAGGTSTLLDEEIVPIVVDGPTGPTGPTGPQGPTGPAGQDAPRYLGLYAYANRGSITGMIAGDLVVLYSATQAERGIYAYVSSTWTKQSTPTQDQIMRCMVGVLDAVRQGYGVSADYIGAGATSFETLLVNFIYAQYALISGSIRAGTRYDQAGNETNPTKEGVWIGANGKIKGAINDVEPDQVTPSFTRRQLFTSSGTWAVPAHVKWVRVTAMGGGGGGGGSGGVTASAEVGTAYDGNAGQNGGASSFGSYVVANGGAGGTGTGGGGSGGTGQNGGSSDFIGGYNGANGGAGTAKGTTNSAATGTKTSGAGGGRGASSGLYDANVELSNASGGLTKTPTISAGRSKTNSASASVGIVVSNGGAGDAGLYGAGGGGATGGCYAYKSPDASFSAWGASGGGGGAGALRQRVFRINEVYGQSITVTVGAGGTGGTAGGGSTATGAAGGNGGKGWVLVEW